MTGDEVVSRGSSNSGRLYWACFGLICAVVLVPIFLAGLYSRSSLNSLLKEGGLLESSPVLLLLSASILAAIAAFREKRFFPWGAYALLCFFFAGEEASWGEDGLLGWHFIPEEEKRPTQDLHNYLSNVLEDYLGHDGGLDIPVRVANLITGSVMLMAVFFLMSVLILGYFGSDKLTKYRPLGRLKIRALPLQFVVAGIGLIAFGNIDILQESFGLPYLPGMWPLEESFEVLGSVALLIASIAKFRATGH